MLIAAVTSLLEWMTLDSFVQNASVVSSPLVAARVKPRSDELLVVTDLKGLERLSEGWRALDKAAMVPTPFQTFQWVQATAEAILARGGQIAVVVAGPVEQPSVIMPLAIERRLGVRMARWLGEPLIQYGDGVAADPSRKNDIAACWAAVRALPVDVVLLRNVRDTAALAPFLRTACVPVGPVETSRYLDLSLVRQAGSFDRMIGASVGKRNRVAERRLSGQGALEFRVHTGAAARPWAEAAIAMKRLWLSERGLTGSILEDESARQVLVDLCGQEGGAVSTLMVDGTLAAAELGFHHRGHYIAYLGAYCPKLSSFSPGRTQMRGTIDWCQEQGFSAYDLLAPDDGYKLEWTTSQADVHSLGYANTLIGKAFLAASRMRPGVKAAYYALPPALRRVFSRMIPN